MSRLHNCENQPFHVKDEVDSLADWSSWIVMRNINSKNLRRTVQHSVYICKQHFFFCPSNEEDRSFVCGPRFWPVDPVLFHKKSVRKSIY